MPVRSLTSSVLRWPDREAVRAGGGAGHDEVVPHGPGGPDAVVLPVEDRPAAVVPAWWFERKLLCTIWPLSPWRNEAEPT